MPEVSARTAARAAIGEGGGFNAIRRDYEVIPDGLRDLRFGVHVEYVELSVADVVH